MNKEYTMKKAHLNNGNFKESSFIARNIMSRQLSALLSLEMRS